MLTFCKHMTSTAGSGTCNINCIVNPVLDLRQLMWISHVHYTTPSTLTVLSVFVCRLWVTNWSRRKSYQQQISHLHILVRTTRCSNMHMPQCLYIYGLYLATWVAGQCLCSSQIAFLQNKTKSALKSIYTETATVHVHSLTWWLSFVWLSLLDPLQEEACWVEGWIHDSSSLPSLSSCFLDIFSVKQLDQQVRQTEETLLKARL